MKRLFRLFVLLFVAIAIVACDKPQNNDDNTNDDNTQDTGNQDQNQNENNDDNKQEENKQVVISYVVTNGETTESAVAFTYDEANKVYKATVNVSPAFTSISFYKDNSLLDSETTTVTGDFDAASSSLALTHTDDTSVFILGDVSVNLFNFTYDLENNTLAVEAVEKLNVDSLASVVINGTPNTAKANSASVFDAGKKLREFEIETEKAKQILAEFHVLYLIVDAEGKIVYVAQNQTSGYAGPSDDFYCHSSYKVTSGYHSVFNVLDTYQPWGPDVIGRPWNHFEIIVPEGCFAIVAHGEVVRDIFTALGVPSDIVNLHASISDGDDNFSPKVNVSTLLDNNTHGIAADSIRVAMDGNNLVVYEAK